jgi:chromate transporter
MMRSLTPDRERATLAVAAAALVLAVPSAWGQLGAILAGGVIGLALFRDSDIPKLDARISAPIGRHAAFAAIAIFFALLIALPLAATTFPFQSLQYFDVFYRVGSLVFGGGHVVLPLLQAEVVTSGWVSNASFLAGYGAAQAVPGPLFTFAAFLGASMNTAPSGWLGGLLCLAAIFLPSFLLLAGILPFWTRIRQNQGLRSALVGVNAAVVGLLLAAFFSPVLTSGILSAGDAILAGMAMAMLIRLMWPAWYSHLTVSVMDSSSGRKVKSSAPSTLELSNWTQFVAYSMASSLMGSGREM